MIVNGKMLTYGPNNDVLINNYYFSEGGRALALDDGACDPSLFQKGGIFPTTNKTLKGHSYHLIFHIKRLSGVLADRNIKDSYLRLCYH